MKKLNRKGFTLIELLAVVVVLAVILVVAIPTVLDTMEKSKVKSFEDAVVIIQDYIQKNYEMSQMDQSLNTTGITFTPEEGKSTIPLTKAQITAAGYSTNDIVAFEFHMASGKVVVDCATAAGNFVQNITGDTNPKYKACTTAAA